MTYNYIIGGGKNGLSVEELKNKITLDMTLELME